MTEDEHMLAFGETLSLLQDHALTVGKSIDTLQNQEIGTLAGRVSFATHEARAEKLREVITRVVQAVEIGDNGIDLEAAHNRLSSRPDRAGVRALEETLIDDLVLAVGQILTREEV